MVRPWTLVQQAIQERRFITLLLDETTDAANICQLVVHLRFSLHGNMYSFFGGMKPLGIKKDQKAITTSVEEFIKGMRCTFCCFTHQFLQTSTNWHILCVVDKRIPKHLTHIGSDGGSQFSGRLNGFNVVWKRDTPHSETTHCLNHREALCVRDVSYTRLYVYLKPLLSCRHSKVLHILKPSCSRQWVKLFGTSSIRQQKTPDWRWYRYTSNVCIQTQLFFELFDVNWNFPSSIVCVRSCSTSRDWNLLPQLIWDGAVITKQSMYL